MPSSFMANDPSKPQVRKNSTQYRRSFPLGLRKYLSLLYAYYKLPKKPKNQNKNKKKHQSNKQTKKKSTQKKPKTKSLKNFKKFCISSFILSGILYVNTEERIDLKYNLNQQSTIYNFIYILKKQ